LALITGLGVAVPGLPMPQELTISHAQKFCCNDSREERILAKLYRRSGIERRSSILGLEDSHRPAFFPPRKNPKDRGPTTASRMLEYKNRVTSLALDSTVRALDDANLKGSDITHLVTVSCTGFAAPGFDIKLIEKLAMRDSVSRLNVGFMGCHGMINALKMAAFIASAEASAKVLICAAELCSIHFQYGWDRSNVLANALFADGSSAVVVESSTTSSQRTLWEISKFRSKVVPQTEDIMSWNIGDNGFQMTLSPNIPDVIAGHLADWFSDWLHSSGLSVEEIDSWAIHPGGPRVLESVESALRLSAQDLLPSREILARYGNMSSPTVIFILDRLRNRSGLACVLGFGPGLAIEALLLNSCSD
jgi:predicted naringenin-chalcone synthase